MPQYECLVKDKDGKNLTGVHEAQSVDDVISWLRDQGYLIIRVTEVKPKGKLFSIGKGGKRASRIKLDEIVIFSRQLATMVEAGVPLVQSLGILAEQVENLNMQNVVLQMHDEVESGKSLSEAMEAHRKVFSPLFVSMVKAGESSGKLEEILDRLATYTEKSSQLQKKIKSAMVYPAVVGSMALVITMGMLTWVIPQFSDIFDSLNAPLPRPTFYLIKLSEIMRQNFLLFAVGGMVGVFGFMQLIRTGPGRYLFDSFKLKIPVFGSLFLKVAVSKFSRTLSTLVKSGIPILSAFEIVEETAENKRVEKVIREVRTSVKRGENISEPLGRGGIFPAMVVRMIAVGEETGELDKMLSKIADFYDTQVDTAVDGLTSLIEPFIIAFLGIVIGGIVISMFLPILTLTGSMG